MGWSRWGIVIKYKNETDFDFQGPVFILNIEMENTQNVQYLMLKDVKWTKNYINWMDEITLIQLNGWNNWGRIGNLYITGAFENKK